MRAAAGRGAWCLSRRGCVSGMSSRSSRLGWQRVRDGSGRSPAKLQHTAEVWESTSVHL